MWPFAVGFMQFYPIILEKEHVEKKVKSAFMKNVKNTHFVNALCDLCTWSTRNLKVYMERQWPQLSCGTLGFKFDAPVESQRSFENHGSLCAMAKSQ